MLYIRHLIIRPRTGTRDVSLPATLQETLKKGGAEAAGMVEGDVCNVVPSRAYGQCKQLVLDLRGFSQDGFIAMIPGMIAVVVARTLHCYSVRNTTLKSRFIVCCACEGAHIKGLRQAQTNSRPRSSTFFAK